MGEDRQAGRIAAHPLYNPFGRIARPAEEAGQALHGGFSWVPRLCQRLYALDLPQKLAVPLKTRRRLEEREYAFGQAPEYGEAQLPGSSLVGLCALTGP